MSSSNDYKITQSANPHEAAIFEGTKMEVFAVVVQMDGFPLDVYCTALMTYQSAREFVQEVLMEDFVDKFHQMDVSSEDVVPNGRSLSNGMVVLAEASGDKVRFSEVIAGVKDWEVDRFLGNNRWCIVTNLDTNENGVRFIGVYSDGTKRRRFATIQEAWFVKIDSIPDPVVDEEVEAQRYVEVYDILKTAFGAFELLVQRHDYPASSIDAYPGKITRKIMGVPWGGMAYPRDGIEGVLRTELQQYYHDVTSEHVENVSLDEVVSRISEKIVDAL